MTPERADRLRHSVRDTSGIAGAIVDRLRLIEPNGALPIDFEDRSEVIATTLEMVIANADIALEIHRSLENATAPVISDLKNASFAMRVREEMLDVIRDAATIWDDELASDWREVVGTVAGAILPAA